jgi:uncharacterized protein YndB with AHSA1/START domain
MDQQPAPARTHNIVVKRPVDARRERVWRAWSEAELIRR